VKAIDRPNLERVSVSSGAAETIGDTAKAWLRSQIEEGRLAPALDDEQLAVVAGMVIAAGNPSRKHRPVLERLG